MKIIKYIFSVFIIFFTLKIIISLSKKSGINLYDFFLNHYLLIISSIILQVIGVFLSTLRWRKSVQYFANNTYMIYEFSEFFYLTSRANIINNFLPSILIGDLSKLISPNKRNKKREMKFIIFDRLIGFFTLGNLGLLSMLYIDLLNLNIYIILIITEILILFLVYKIKFRFTKGLQENILTLNFCKIVSISFLSQFFFSLSLFILLNIKNYYDSFHNYFISIFLNFLGMFPFSINGWGIREWSANKISFNQLDSNNLITASIIFGICISISNLLIYIFLNIKKIKN